MKVTFSPEKYSTHPVSISVPMSRENEQKILDTVKPIETVQEIISILKAITGR